MRELVVDEDSRLERHFLFEGWSVEVVGKSRHRCRRGLGERGDEMQQIGIRALPFDQVECSGIGVFASLSLSDDLGSVLRLEGGCHCESQ